MKNKKLLILLPALLLSLAACGGTNNGGGSKNNPSSQSDTVAVTAVAINKTTLALEPQESETLTASVTPENASDTSVTWSSSNEAVATVSALGKVTGVAEGTATITATSVSNPTVKGECALTVRYMTAKELYGAAHKGTEDDPLTNEDAVLVAKHESVGETATAKEYYVKGEVDYFQEVPNEKGNVSFAFKPAEGKDERFIAYRVKKGAKLEAVSFDDVWKGGQATIKGKIVNYKGNTPETAEANKGVLVKCEGTKVEPATITGKTVADAAAAIAQLHANETTFDKYEVTGYITKVESAGTFFMSDTKGEVTSPAETDFEVFGYTGDNKNECTLNAKVKVTCALKNYVSTSSSAKQYETGAVYAVEILEEGDEAPLIVKGATPLAEVANDTEYFAGMNQATINKNCFVTGAVSSNALVTGSFDQAKEVILEEATNGFNLKFKGGKYVNMDNSQKLVLGDTATTVYTWDAVTKSLVTVSGETNYYICAYGTRDVLGFSAESYVVADGKVLSGQFPLQFYAKEAKVAPTEIQITQRVTVEAESAVELELRYNPYNADMSSLTWTSSSDAVATVAKGVVTGVAEGTATITAAVGEVKDTCAVTVTPCTAEIKPLPADGLVIDAAVLDLATNNTYAKNNNRDVAIGAINITLDPKSVGSITKASAPFTNESGKLGINCMQFKAGNYIAFKTKDKLQAATLATVELYTNGYATQGKDYLPYFLVGADVTPILANETNGGTANVAGVETGVTVSNKKLYKLTLTYDLSGLNEAYLTFVTAKSGAAYIGKITIENAVAQPTGQFHGLAKTSTGSFVPVDAVLAADSAGLSIKGEAQTVSSYQWNGATSTLSIVTSGSYGTITATFANNVFTITGISGEGVSEFDLTFAVQLSGNCLYLDCNDMDQAAVTATFLRRYDREDNNGWQSNGSGSDKLWITNDGKEGKGVQCKGFLDNGKGKIGLSLKNDLPTPIPGTKVKSIGCWIKNPGNANVSTTLFAYKGAGRTSAAQLNTFTLQPGWNFVQSGVVNGSNFTTANSLYNFQFYIEHVNDNLIYDNFCIYM